MRAAGAYWNVTGQADPCVGVLARHVSAQPAGRAALEALLAMSRLPAECLQTVRHLAHALARLAYDGSPNWAPHADDVMRDNARALLLSQEH